MTMKRPDSSIPAAEPARLGTHAEADSATKKAIDRRETDATDDDAAPQGPRAARMLQIERHVGTLVRMRRIMLGLSQSQLAAMLGVTLQQVNKYERGHSRISSGRLFQISEALGVSVDFFYQGLGDLRETPTAPSRDRICLEVMRSFGMIKNERHQEALNQLVRALADREG
jgi:transcriptional regulator with XRE-family HTH domain